MFEVLIMTSTMLYLFSNLMCLIITFPLILIKYPKEGYLKDFSSNMKTWKKYPIYNISISEEIQSGFEEYSFFDWPGSKSGCNCLNVRDFSQLYLESCNSYKKNAGCINVNAQKPQKISRFNSKKFSVIYYKENYFTLLSRTIEKGKNCKNGFKKCSYLDSLKNVFCVKEDESCPSNLYKNNQNETNIKNDLNDYLLNRLVISQSKGPCLREIDNLIYDNLILYNNYEGNQNVSQCFDNHFQLIDSFKGKKKDLYKENGINYTGINFSEFDSNDIFLFKFIYPGISTTYVFYSYDSFFIYYHHFHFYFSNFLKLLIIISFYKFNIWESCSFSENMHSKKKEKLFAMIIGIIILFSYIYFYFINDSFYRIFYYIENQDNYSRLPISTINFCYIYDIISGLIGILICVLIYLFPQGTDEPKSVLLFHNEISNISDSLIEKDIPTPTPNSNLIQQDSDSNLIPKPQDLTKKTNSNRDSNLNAAAPIPF